MCIRLLAISVPFFLPCHCCVRFCTYGLRSCQCLCHLFAFSTFASVLFWCWIGGWKFKKILCLQFDVLHSRNVSCFYHITISWFNEEKCIFEFRSGALEGMLRMGLCDNPLGFWKNCRQLAYIHIHILNIYIYMCIYIYVYIYIRTWETHVVQTTIDLEIVRSASSFLGSTFSDIRASSASTCIPRLLGSTIKISDFGANHTGNQQAKGPSTN
jgi:hypothetical protein